MLPNKLPDDLNELSSLWLTAKELERYAVEDRRRVEDRIKSLVGVSETLEGTETAEPSEYIIKIVGRIDRKVDADKVQELAAEHGLSDHLSTLFRWKPEINMSAWKNADAQITSVLTAAITAKSSRPSFVITRRN